MIYDSSNSNIDWGRIIRWSCVVFLTAFVGLYQIFAITSMRETYEFQKRAAMEPHRRTYGEFTGVFNELMAEQGISMDESVTWDTSEGYARTVSCTMSFPDGSQAPCYVELWSRSVEKGDIMWIHVTFSKEQAAYMEPVVQGVFSIFAPEPGEDTRKTFVKILRACNGAFQKYPYDRYWDVVAGGTFALKSSTPDSVTLIWQFST